MTEEMFKRRINEERIKKLKVMKNNYQIIKKDQVKTKAITPATNSLKVK